MQRAADEAMIRRIMDEYLATWRRHDMDAWGELFTDDTDFVTHAGQWWQSSRENVIGHKTIPAAVLAQKASYRNSVTKISFLAADVALVHASWEWPGFVPRPEEAPTDLKGIITMVLVLRDGRWRIRASQNTKIV